MAKNSSLNAASIAKQDEFYTRYEDIQEELNHYEQHFRDKTVLCNCDDPFESNFCKTEKSWSSKKSKRGGKEYIPPLGWFGISLKVSEKYEKPLI